MGRKEISMSEIKGQLLGIILVLMVFGAVSAAMMVVFTNLTKSVEEKVDEIIDSSSSKRSGYRIGKYYSYK